MLDASKDCKNEKAPAQSTSSRKKRKASSSEPRLKSAAIQRMIALRFLNKSSFNLPPTGSDYRVYEKKNSGERGDFQIISVDANEVATKVKLSVVARAMGQYIHSFNDEKLHVSDHEIESSARLWLKLAPFTRVPAAFHFKSKPGLCFNRLPFDPVPGPTPQWDSMLGGTLNRDAAQAFIWSLFIRGSYDQQYLYLKGEGGDGKGCLVRFLEKIFGYEMKVIQRPPSDDNKHFGMDFEDKRVVAFSDLRNPKFLRSDVVMGITGNDTLQVDPKGGAPYNIRADCKLLFCSNKLPIIGSQHSERRRIIFAEMPPIDPERKHTRGFEDRLWEEGGAFLAKCKETYERLCPDYGIIPQDEDAITRINSFAEEVEGGDFQEFFEDKFVLYPYDRAIPKKEQRYVMASTMDHLIKGGWPKDVDRRGFRTWMKTVHGLTAEQRWFPLNILSDSAPPADRGGRNEKVYYRLGLRNQTIKGNDPLSWRR
jgi:hypothetical protein